MIKKVESREEAIEIVKKNGENICYLPRNLRSDKEIAIYAMESCGFCLYVLDSNLRDDEQVVSIAIKNCPSSIIHASNRLQRRLRKI